MVIEVNIAQPIVLEVFNTVTEERVLEVQGGGLVTTTDLTAAVTAAASSASAAAASATAAANVPTFSGVLENALVRKTSTGVASSLLFDTGVFLRSSANLVLGATVSQGNRLEVTGNSLFTGAITVTGNINGISMGNRLLQSLFIGGGALQSATSGFDNIVIGEFALSQLVTSNRNIVVGRQNSNLITSGADIVSFGFQANRLNADGSNSTIQNNSLFIGNDSRPLANNQTNQIVIGHTSRGLGSNTTLIGNSGTQTFGMWGQLRFMALTSPPASMTATGIAGETRMTANGLYICIATNTWRLLQTTTF